MVICGNIWCFGIYNDFSLLLNLFTIRMNKKIALLISMILFHAVSFAQCSMCRAVVETDISGKGTGINNGIVYLMAFPYALVVFIAFGLVYKMKRDSRKTI